MVSEEMPENYNIEVFRSLREEIKARINTHYKLVITKFGGVGALFSFFVSGLNSELVSPYLVCAIYSFVFDIVILENLAHMRFIGEFIKEKVEPIYSSPYTIRWESEGAQYNNWKCFSKISYWLGIGSIGYVMFFIYLASFLRSFNVGLIVSTVFAIYVGYLINKHLG